MLRKIINWSVVLFIIYYMVNDPTAAAATFHQIGSLLGRAASSFSTLVSSLGH